MRSAFLAYLIFLATLGGLSQGSGLLYGFAGKIKGQDLVYHSPHADVGLSLLVRSGDSSAFIEWYAQPVPAETRSAYAEYIMMAGIDVNPEDRHTFKYYINDSLCFILANPEDTLQNPVIQAFSDSIGLRFEKLMVDKYGDLMGYLYLNVPASEFATGKPLKMAVRGEHAGSMSWFMVFQKSIKPEWKLIEEQAIIRDTDGEYQQFRLDIVHLGEPSPARIQAGNQVSTVPLKKGYNITRFRIPRVDEPTYMPIEISVDGQMLYGLSTRIMPVTPRTIHLIHHSHVDIGYTHVQEEVLEKQWEWLEMAISLARGSRNDPPEAQFRWNVETMWAVDQYLQSKEEPEQEALLNAISKGWIELDAFYANNLMALSNEAELVRMTESARETAARCGVELKSAMISDIPGWSWGLVPVLAKSGVKYLSLGTNQGHRIGHTIREWGDKPFYWISPSGKEKVLTWIHGQGYSMFHTGLGYEKLNRELAETKILEYTQQLYADSYPYGIVPLRYNIGSDNGPPDKNLSRFVMQWNEKYVTPKLQISTVSNAFAEFEEKYGDSIPEVSGDFTAFWEDGAISSARETAMNQRNSERLVQAEALYAMLQPHNYPAGEFRKCWSDVLLFNEHTWGSWNSISEPEAEFTLHQWKVKKAFATRADSMSRVLLHKAIGDAGSALAVPGKIEVLNTSSWARTGPVIIPGLRLSDQHILVDSQGNETAWQRLSSGEIVFIASDVPAFGSKVYTAKHGQVKPAAELKAWGNSMENEYYKIIFNEDNGSIAHLIDKLKGRELVDAAQYGGLNEYWYVGGRDPANRWSTVSCQLSIVEMGPVLARMSLKSEAKGCNDLVREITLYDGLDYIEINNVLDKQKIYEPEGVHFAFPFNISEPVVTVDLAFGNYSPEKGQIKGCNKNFFTAERYIDVSNPSFGVTLVSPDAPLFEIGDIMNDPIVYGWMDKVVPSSWVFSYVMNNYWETNYLAAQEGPAGFQYVIRPHETFDPAYAEKFSMEICQPLIATIKTEDAEPAKPLFHCVIDNPGIIVPSLKPASDGRALIITVFNPGNEERTFTMNISGEHFDDLYHCDLDGHKIKKARGELKLSPLEFTRFRVDLSNLIK